MDLILEPEDAAGRAPGHILRSAWLGLLSGMTPSIVSFVTPGWATLKFSQEILRYVPTDKR